MGELVHADAEADLWQSLEVAAQFPQAADMTQLLQDLEQAMQFQTVEEQMRVAGEVLVQLSQVYVYRSEQMFDEWEQRYDPKEPVLDSESCVGLFVQSQHLDVQDLVELTESTVYPKGRKPRSVPIPFGSVVGEVDKEQLLAVLDELGEQAQHDQAMSVAHDEDVSGWVATVAGYVERQPGGVCLMDVVQGVGYPLVQTWLTLLLGGFVLEQRGEFYGGEIWVRRNDHFF